MLHAGVMTECTDDGRYVVVAGHYEPHESPSWVFVTDRMVPLRVDGRGVHQIWMPYHWAQTGLTTGDVVNDLIGVVADANIFIQENKVLTCDIQPGRRPRGPALTD